MSGELNRITVSIVPTQSVGTPPLALLRPGNDDAGASGDTSRRTSVGTMNSPSKLAISFMWVKQR
jgi:hypothetical protein